MFICVLCPCCQVKKVQLLLLRSLVQAVTLVAGCFTLLPVTWHAPLACPGEVPVSDAANTGASS